MNFLNSESEIESVKQFSIGGLFKVIGLVILYLLIATIIISLFYPIMFRTKKVKPVDNRTNQNEILLVKKFESNKAWEH